MDYQKEAAERWGNTAAYKESVEKVRGTSEERLAQIKHDGEELLQKLSELTDVDVHDEQVQLLVDEHYKNLSNFYTPNSEIYRGLAELYLQDPQFKKYFETFHPKLPQFLHDAMLIYIEHI